MHKVHSVPRCWSCITGPLGLKKEGSKEKIDEGLVQLKSPQCVAHLSFWLTKLLLDKFNSHVLQMTFWTFDGDHVLHNSEKMLFIIAHKCLFHPAWVAPSGDGGEERRLPQAIPARRPTNRHHHWLAWNSNFWKTVMARKYDEEEIDWPNKMNRKIENVFMGALF